MSVNLISHKCFHCGEPITMEACAKFYSISDLRDVINREDSKEIIEKNKIYQRCYCHFACKSKIIEEILQKIPDSKTF